MPQTEAIRILIAHDETLTREGLVTILNRCKEIKVVCAIENISELMKALDAHRPDIMLIDLRLNGLDGVEVIQGIHKSYPTIAVVILSSYEGSEDIYRALRAGVRGYLMRDASSDEIIQAILTVKSGGRHIPNEIAVRLAERMDGSTLSERELQVLQQIVKGKSNREIADLLNITEATVKYHVTSILTKLGVTDRTQAATVALHRGILHLQDI